LTSGHLQSNTQSAPSSPKSQLKTRQPNASDLVVKPKRLYQKNQSSSTSSLGAFFRKIARLKRPSSKPWIFINIQTHDINTAKNTEIITPFTQLHVVNNQSLIEKSSNSSAQRSQSETKIQLIQSTQRKPLQDLKSVLKLEDKKTNNEVEVKCDNQ